MKIGVIGTGVIASKVIEGIAEDGHEISVSERGAKHAARLAERFSNVTIRSNAGVVAASDVIFLGLLAGSAPAILAALDFREGQQVISFMADATREEVAAMVAPARVEAVMLPFPGIARGGSPIILRGDAALATEIFAPRNTITVAGSDAEMAAYLVAQAVLSPAVQMVADAAAWVEEQGHDGAKAAGFLKHLVGSSLMASDPGPLLAALNLPGGYNARLRDHMEKTGQRRALRAGLDVLAHKA